MAGARSAQEVWIEQTPSPDGTCLERGTGGVDEIWAEAPVATRNKLDAKRARKGVFRLSNIIDPPVVRLRFPQAISNAIRFCCMIARLADYSEGWFAMLGLQLDFRLGVGAGRGRFCSIRELST